MAAKKKGLGRGLDALFPEKPVQEKVKQPKKENNIIKEDIKVKKEDSSGTSETIKEKDPEEIKNEDNKNIENKETNVTKPAGELMVRVSKVEPNRNQPRKKFDEDALLELSESIKQYGVLQPLLVSDKKDYYEIIAGERRWRAAKMAGLKEIPVVIKELSNQEMVEISLIENIQREDLNPVEEAQAYKQLIEDYNLKQDEIADRVSKSRTAVTNALRLLKLDTRVQQMMIDEMITAGHARAILGISDPETQYTVAMKVFDEKLSVRETEKLVKHLTEPVQTKEKTSNPAEDAIYENLEERLKGITGTRVQIQRKKNNKGKIEIDYYSKEDLERIIDLFESIG